jgi:hypothetical protein
MADQDVATVSTIDDLEALRLGRTDHDDFFDPGMSLKGVCCANRSIPGDEKTDFHVGRTGFHSSAGAGSSLLRRKASAAAAANTITTSGERRFTKSSV